MFKNVFSFEGRIRRKEYGLTLIGYYAVFFAIEWGTIGRSTFESGTPSPGASAVFLLCLFPLVWVMLAQGAKRCHDMGKNGWWQLIPFYALWMLFQQGNYGMNRYGVDPKNPSTEEFSFETNPNQEQTS